MTERERTVFAATEAIFGAGLVLAALVVSAAGGFGRVIGLVVLVLGVLAVGQSVLVGLGLISISDGSGGGRNDD